MWQVVIDHADLFFRGLWVTLLLSVASWLIAFSVAVVIAMMRIAPQLPLRFISGCYIEFLRNIPPIVIIFFSFFALPSLGITLSAFFAVALGVGLYGSAVVAEVIRSGIASIPRGQYEAAISSGMSYVQTMRHVILPQAMRVVVPPLGTETINIIKNTSLGAAVSAGELLGVANLVGARTFAYTACLIAAAVLYIALTWPAAYAVNALERRLARSSQR